MTPGDTRDPDAEAPGGMEAIDTDPVTDSEDPGGMSGIPDPEEHDEED